MEYSASLRRRMTARGVSMPARGEGQGQHCGHWHQASQMQGAIPYKCNQRVTSGKKQVCQHEDSVRSTESPGFRCSQPTPTHISLAALLAPLIATHLVLHGCMALCTRLCCLQPVKGWGSPSTLRRGRGGGLRQGEVHTRAHEAAGTPDRKPCSTGAQRSLEGPGPKG